ncbi:MAG: (Fe-S)-binding protein [Bacteroidota bacterium]|nr:(Fe-S)-binding protein [Bacteroidota bacterium]
MIISQIFFAIITLVTFYLAAREFYNIWQKIHLGKREEIGGDVSARWKNVMLVAFGQQKMFKKVLPAVLHLFIYTAFLLTQVELFEIIIDGITGSHRFFAHSLGFFYTFIIGLIEVLSALALIATIIFLARRNILRVKRFWKAEMTEWPRLDANLILFGELALVIAILSMNSADTMLQQIDPEKYHSTGSLPVSSWLGPMLMNNWSYDWLLWTERIGWWIHVLVVYAFILYLPFSKHLHIFLAFPNTWFARLKPRGKMLNMPEITQEVRSMLGLPQGQVIETDGNTDFGAKDIQQLSWKNILDAFTCTECGRCTAVCPANITGKKLSPRKIMMDIRDRTEEVSKKINSHSPEYIATDKKAEGILNQDTFDDGRSLFDYISEEEIYACTACNACVEACPVMIDPLEPILQMRRYQILMESKGPGEWLPMFNSLESGGAVWQVPSSRSHWTEQVEK